MSSSGKLAIRGSLVALTMLCLAGPGVAQVLSGPLVVSERWPQCTDLASWTRDVMRLENLENAPETAQAKAFFRWLRLFSRMATGGMIQAYEGEYGKEQYVLDAHKNLFVYGWGYCDTSSRIAEAAWSEFKRDRSAAERVCVMHDDGGFHTMYRLKLDGKYGAFDPRYGYYLVDRDAPDARILDWAEVGVDENFKRNRNYQHRSQPFFEYFGLEWQRALLLQPEYFASEAAWRKAGGKPECVFGDGQYQMGTRFHDMDFDLARGMTIERYWDGSAHVFYVPAGTHTRRDEPFLPSGRFYRVTETMLDGNWVKYDPNYRWAKPYLTEVPADQGYNKDVAGGKTLGQAWGRLTYEPDFRQMPELVLPGSTLVHAAAAPHLRPAVPADGGSATLDFRCPYIFVDGSVEGELSGDPDDALKLEIRVLQAKPSNEAQPDVWSDWRQLHSGRGRFLAPLGRTQAGQNKPGIFGAYRFQIRLTVPPNHGRTAAAGLSELRLTAAFETGIMSIPQILAGHNTIHFKIADSTLIKDPIQVIYRYQDAAGARAHTQTLRRQDFRSNTASYSLETPTLTRCTSLIIKY